MSEGIDIKDLGDFFPWTAYIEITAQDGSIVETQSAGSTQEIAVDFGKICARPYERPTKIFLIDREQKRQLVWDWDGSPATYDGPPVRPPQPDEPMMQFFAYAHLPQELQTVSHPFCELACTIVNTLPQNPERTVALRKLLEAKDCAVRAAMFR